MTDKDIYVHSAVNGIVYTQLLHAKKAAHPPSFKGTSLRTKERRTLPIYVTYAGSFQLLIFIAALVGLVYEIAKNTRK